MRERQRDKKHKSDKDRGGYGGLGRTGSNADASVTTTTTTSSNDMNNSYYNTILALILIIIIVVMDIKQDHCSNPAVSHGKLREKKKESQRPQEKI